MKIKITVEKTTELPDSIINAARMWVEGEEQTIEEHLAEVIGKLLDIPDDAVILKVELLEETG